MGSYNPAKVGPLPLTEDSGQLRAMAPDDFTKRLNKAFEEAVRDRPLDEHGRPYSQNKLEKGANLKRGQANRYLHGDRGSVRPSINIVQAFASELGVRWEWLLTGEEPKYPNASLEERVRRLEAERRERESTPKPPESAERPSNRPFPGVRKSH